MTLSRAAIEFLLSYREENTYKEIFHCDQEKEWLEITKDVMAFANTHGGYVVFNVRDASFQIVELDPRAASVLSNTNLILQKINRFVEPEINGLSAAPQANEQVPRSPHLRRASLAKDKCYKIISVFLRAC